MTLKLRRVSAPDLAVSLKGKLDGPFFKRAALGLERLLKDTRASVTLRVDALQAHHFDHFQGLLRRLARYGDRVHIVVDERLRALVPIDSSVFNLVLAEGSRPLSRLSLGRRRAVSHSAGVGRIEPGENF